MDIIVILVLISSILTPVCLLIVSAMIMKTRGVKGQKRIESVLKLWGR